MRAFRYLPEFLFLFIVAFILINQLVSYPIVGLANSGDFSRLMDWFGLTYRGTDEMDCHKLFLVRLFDWSRQIEIHYPSSEVPLIGAAVLTDFAVTRDGLFDIRFLGAIHVLCFLLVMLLLTRYARTLSLGRRLVLYGLTAFIFTDVGYAAYFQSFFSEPSSLIFLGGTVGFALALAAEVKPGRSRLVLSVGFFVCAMLFCVAKVQNVFLSLPLAVLGYGLMIAVRPEDKLQAKRLRRWAILLTACLLMCAAVDFAAYTLFSRQLRATNIYNSVFHEILARSPSPVDDADALGLEPWFVEYTGTFYQSAEVPAEVKSEVASRVTSAKLVRFYILHPARLLDFSSQAAENAFNMRPTYLGNFESAYVLRDGSEPAVRSMQLPSEYFSRRFAVWSSIKGNAAPKTLWFVIVFVLANAAVIVLKRVRIDRTPGDRMITNLHATLVVMIVVQFLTVVMGEGLYEIAKHLFLFNLLCEVCLVFLVMYAAGGATAFLPARRRLLEARQNDTAHDDVLTEHEYQERRDRCEC